MYVNSSKNNKLRVYPLLLIYIYINIRINVLASFFFFNQTLTLHARALRVYIRVCRAFVRRSSYYRRPTIIVRMFRNDSTLADFVGKIYIIRRNTYNLTFKINFDNCLVKLTRRTRGVYAGYITRVCIYIYVYVLTTCLISYATGGESAKTNNRKYSTRRH